MSTRWACVTTTATTPTRQSPLLAGARSATDRRSPAAAVTSRRSRHWQKPAGPPWPTPPMTSLTRSSEGGPVLTTLLDLLGLASFVAAFLLSAAILLGSIGLVGALILVAAVSLGTSW